MLLNRFTFNTPEPANIVTEQILAKLRTVQDDTPQNLNVSVEFGLDSVLWDVMYGGVNSTDDQFPMIRAFYGNIKRVTDDDYGLIYQSIVPLSLYFLYYIGVPSSDSTRYSIVEARENHIRYNLEAINLRNLTPKVDSVGDIWMWHSEPSQDNETPFKYLDSSYVISPNSGFTCSRVDMEFSCKGVLGYPLP